MNKKDKKIIINEFLEQAQSLDWDELASEIITIDLCMVSEGRPKFLNLLVLRLEIFEEEKMSRVSDSFDYEYFMNKDFAYFDEDMFVK